MVRRPVYAPMVPSPTREQPPREPGPVLGALAGEAGVFRDPVWAVEVTLTAAERALLRTWPVRRLHHVCHAGAARLTTAQTYTRLEHSLGVLSLVAYLAPGDADLRAAALLHDIGHLPYSHTLEGLHGLNHHQLGLDLLIGLWPVLRETGVNPDQVTAYLNGATPSPLLGRPGLLNLDHLDSFVRSAAAGGWLATEPRVLLDTLRVVDQVVDTDPATAGILVDLICAEARYHLSWANIAPAAVLRQLVATLTDDDSTGIAGLTDQQLWALLEADPRTAAESRALLREPYRLMVRPGHDADGIAYSVRKVYRPAPTIRGRPTAESAPDLAQRLSALGDLPRHFTVAWRVGDSGR